MGFEGSTNIKSNCSEKFHFLYSVTCNIFISGLLYNLLKLYPHCFLVVSDMQNACYVTDTVLSSLQLVTHLILMPIR